MAAGALADSGDTRRSGSIGCVSDAEQCPSGQTAPFWGGPTVRELWSVATRHVCGGARPEIEPMGQDGSGADAAWGCAGGRGLALDQNPEEGGAGLVLQMQAVEAGG